jgi:7,8-dihydropterin-6-yl-methyl-4-(beta-D-ribofuranosyl)aminobenzene 5'-phosphate synthase
MVTTKISDLKITVIYDNNSFNKDLQTAWGFACLLRGTEKTILFDTGGDGRLLMDNFRKLGIDPGIVDIVFLSHIHADHTGGLSDFLSYNSEVNVYIPRSFPADFKQDVREAGAEIIEISDSQVICRNVCTTGEMGTRIIEHSLCILTDKGVIVITGCAHPGIINIIERCKEISDNNIRFVMGGFHLMDYTHDQIVEIANKLIKLGVLMTGPCHCTGDPARSVFKHKFAENYIEIGAGVSVVPR